MPDNRFGSQHQDLPSPRGMPVRQPNGEFGIIRTADGHALQPEYVDRGDGVEIPSYANVHRPEGADEPEMSSVPLDYPNE